MLMIRKLALLFCALLLGIVFAEVMVRMFWKEPGHGYPEGLIIPDGTKGYAYKPSFVGNFTGSKFYTGIEVRTNSRGLRDIEHAYEKPPRTTRILGLGDSVMFGSGVRYEDAYLAQLEKMFRENNLSVEIIKAGVHGYALDQELAYYNEEGYKYNPDIVVVGVVLNDPLETDVSKYLRAFGQEETPRARIRNFFARHVKVLRFVYITLRDLVIKRGKDYNDQYFERIYSLWEGESWEKYKAKVLDLKKKLTKERKQLALVIFPYTQQFAHSLNYGRMPQDKIINLSRREGIAVIDLLPVLDTQDYKDFYLPHDGTHPNAKGHAKVADVIYSELKDKKLLKSNTFK